MLPKDFAGRVLGKLDEPYQGVAIIHDPSEGQCITLYGPNDKRDFDLDSKEGQLLDGRKILMSSWLDEPTDIESIREVVNKLLNPELDGE